MRRTLRRDSRARSGSALVEMTIAVPLLVSLFLGTWQFGYAFYLYNELTQAVRAGGRYASVWCYDSTTDTPAATYTQAVQNMVVYGNPAGGTTPVVPGLSADKVDVRMEFKNGSPVGGRVTISIKGFSIGTFWAINLQGKPWADFVYHGRWVGKCA